MAENVIILDRESNFEEELFAQGVQWQELPAWLRLRIGLVVLRFRIQAEACALMRTAKNGLYGLLAKG